MKQQTLENILMSLLATVLVYVCFFLTIVSPPLIKHYSEPKVVYQVIDTKRPTYDYLKSVTVYMVNVMGSIDDKEVMAGRATGTVVAIKGSTAYILTNHHVCESDNVNCYVSLDGEMNKKGLIKLEYVKTGDYENGIDLELWKVDASRLTDKQAIKGLSSIAIADRAYSVGNYLGYPYIYTEGTVAGYDPDGQLFNLPCVFGCSGSGIFNADGEMVAVLYAGHGVPTTVPIISSFDTSKAIAVDYFNVKKFLEGIIDEE